MNKLRAYFRVICAPIRPSIFRHSRQANSVFGGPKIRASGPKFRAGGPKFCTGSMICTTWVKMFEMPPVDNYISIFLLKNRDRP